MSLIFSNFVEVKSLNTNHRMHNLYANLVKTLGYACVFQKNSCMNWAICLDMVLSPKFSDLEVIAPNMTAENMSTNSKNYLFSLIVAYKNKMPHLISRRQNNDRLKYTADLH